jgi:outer membrane protein assembly factor BamE (lipoprotein component of BamABCDE complex)
MKRTPLRALALLSLFLLSGCLVAHSSDQKVTGNFVPPDTFDRIEPGKTTSAWVKATLGEPSSKDTADKNTEIWKYNYSEQKESSGAIFLIFGGSDKKETQHVAYVEMKDGVVTNKWRS